MSRRTFKQSEFEGGGVEQHYAQSAYHCHEGEALPPKCEMVSLIEPLAAYVPARRPIDFESFVVNHLKEDYQKDVNQKANAAYQAELDTQRQAAVAHARHKMEKRAAEAAAVAEAAAAVPPSPLAPPSQASTPARLASQQQQQQRTRQTSASSVAHT
eukprot:TRINITY_DN10146_c0_g1_i1.p1 TRINITY_DN10146_c0_g1~~TRINITY_DN10146_c0_g1_i1.p1  ORF type:complete len:157 (-),score=24.72 TRINITY_DN10146_c0_g1_i1:189-659(-)